MNRKFAVRRVVLTYIPTEDQKAEFPDLEATLACFTSDIFGHAERFDKYSMYVYLPMNCDVFGLSDLIAREAANLEIFEGLDFKIIFSKGDY